MNAASPENDPSDLSISDIYHSILSRLWVVVICFLTAILLAIGYLNVATPLFQSTTTVQVETREARLFNAGSDQQEQDLHGMDILNTIVENLQRISLFERVIALPEIGQDKQFLPEPIPDGQHLTPEQEAMMLQRYIKVGLRRGTRLIDVTVTHPVPIMAQKISGAIVDEYLAETSSNRVGTSEHAGTFLMQQLDGVKSNLQKAEDSLQLYQDAILLRDRIRDQDKVIDDLRQRYRDKHPKMIQANNLLDDLLHDFDQSITAIRQKSPAEKDYWAQGDLDTVGMTDPDRIRNELKRVEARQNVLMRDKDTQTALFENITKQMRDAAVSKESAPTEVILTEPAQLPLYPSKPRRTLIMALAGVMGLVFGVSAAMAIHFMDSSLRTVDDTEKILGIPVLCVTPDIGNKAFVRPRARRKSIQTERAKSAALNASYNSIEVLRDPSSLASESIRNLRATLALIGKEDQRKTILFTSALPGEGKTFTVSNYAVSLAQQGLRTLLIDADLRRPAVHLRFQLPNNGPGLVEHVVNDLELQEAVHLEFIPNLDILLAGGRCPNPAEFLASEGFADVIKLAIKKYDRVIVDSAPVNSVSDTLLIVPYIQSVCLVVHAAKTPRRAVKRAIYTLNMAEVRPVGVVMNKMPRRRGVGHDSYYYYYQASDKYGDVYGKGKNK
jgi:capsular exopolysaccharide synthesis family protein